MPAAIKPTHDAAADDPSAAAPSGTAAFSGRKSEFHRHQVAALKWLKRAQDKSPDDGVSQGFYLRGGAKRSNKFGWRPSYVETSGYIIETFYNYRFMDVSLAGRAERMGRWLVTQQNDDGSYSNPACNPEIGLVFDTGQVLFGLTRCYRETNDPVFLTSARRAAQWLDEMMDEDGGWRRNVFNAQAHTYNSRVAWAMLEFAEMVGDAALRSAGHRAAMWSQAQQLETGLYANCGFSHDEMPFTHTIAYAIRGLFEAGRLSGNAALLKSARLASDAVGRHLLDDGFLPSRIDLKGRAIGGSACLTGNCQMAVIWFRMAEEFSERSYTEMARNALGYVVKTQVLDMPIPDLRGGIKGSHPIWGRYASMSYPNWAAKFYLDALLEEQQR